MRKFYELLLMLAAMMLLTSIFALIYEQRTACIESGGNYLRGAFWFECVK